MCIRDLLSHMIMVAKKSAAASSECLTFLFGALIDEMHPLHAEDNLLYPVYQFRFILVQIYLHAHMHRDLAGQAFQHSMA